MSTDFRTTLRAFATATAIAAAASFTGCGSSEEGPPPDPVGTITTSVNYTANQNPIELYKGIADDGPYAGPSYDPYPYVIISFGMNPSMNYLFHTAIAQNLNTYANPYWYGLGSWGGEVADAGPVGGLGDVTVKPTAGWTSSAAVEVGHGYVVRYKRSKDYAAANVPYAYARVYVVEYLTSALTGGVIGAKLKFQNPF